MQAFTTHSGLVVPLDRANVDTDQIIPKQYLKSIRRTGFGDYLFDGWRFNDQADMGVTPNERDINREFVLNLPQYQGASVLLARQNFGCGSSREHAVWALMEFGIRAVIAPSFADIFYSNCFKNGLLPIALEENIIDELFELADGSLTLEVDLATLEVRRDTGAVHTFALPQALQQKLLQGMDDIDMTLAQRGMIEQFEQHHRVAQPWLFGARGEEAQ